MRETQLEIDLDSAIPPYEQIRAQIAGLVAADRLRPGDRLPTVRALASDLGLAVGTVNRAYRELEAQGLVVTRRRTGTSIADDAAPASNILRDAASGFVTQARGSGLSDEEILAAVRGALMPDTSR